MRFILSKSFILPVLSMAVQSGETPQRQLLDRLRYLADDPVTIGDETFDRQFLVKASDASLGRALVSDPSVRAALAALRERAPGFQLGLESLSTEGPARLVAGITSFDFSAETLAAMDRALRAVLEAMSGLDLVERGARGAA
jgi:hypothetical protein